MMSRYALFHGPGQPLELQQAEVPELSPGEVLVSVDLCTLCGSDLHTYQGDRHVACPTVLGHEMVGRLVATGTDAPQQDSNGSPIEAVTLNPERDAVVTAHAVADKQPLAA